MSNFRSIEYEHSPLLNLSSEKANQLAKQLFDEYKWRDDARHELINEIWPACDDAFACRRDLPRNKGMRWADKSDFGDTDIRDGVQFLANAIVLALMPPDDSWCELYSFKTDDQWRKNKMRDYQEFLHRKSDTRGNYEVHVTQTLVRGVSAIHWEWRKVYRMRKLGFTEAQIKAHALSQILGMEVDPKLVRQHDRDKYLAFNGPIIQTLDMHDVYLDPTVRIGPGHDVPMAVLTYKTLEELKASKDYDGNDMYSNLEGLEPTSMHSIYRNQEARYRSLKTLGVNPLGMNMTDKNYVPILTFHRQLQKLDNSSDQWVDTYFELALTSDFSGCRLIRTYENPSDMGMPCVFLDTYSDFIANTPYQTGVVEKATAAWQSKNVISALTLQADLVNTFPPTGLMVDVLVNPKKFDPSCGAINLVKRTNVGLGFIAPLQVTGTGQMDGKQSQQFYGQKILGSMGAYGAVMQSPDRTITRSKTATQINTENTSGSMSTNNLLQKFIVRSLEPMAQSVMYASIQYNPEGVAEFERAVDGKITGDTLSPEEMQMDWKMCVTGQKAKTNKAQEMEELQTMYQYVTTPNPVLAQSNPMLVPLSNKLLMNILGRLGMKDLEQYEQDAIQLLLKNPMIQQQLQMMAQQIASGQIPPEMLAQGQGGMPPGAGPPQGPPDQGNVLALPDRGQPQQIGQEVQVA